MPDLNAFINPEGEFKMLGESHYDTVVKALETRNKTFVKYLTPRERSNVERLDESGPAYEKAIATADIVYSIMTRMLMDGWIRITSDEEAGTLAIEGKYNQIRRHAIKLTEIVEEAGDVDVVDFGLIRENIGALLLSVSRSSILEDGLLKALHTQRLIEGYSATDLRRRPFQRPVSVRSYRRRKR